MLILILFPFVLQAIVMFFDEFYFHHKRNLPRWERIGHPLDTLSVLLCFIFVLCAPFTAFYVKIYCALALFSCLFVTKDEFVHKEHCSASEQWLHALLFINHPLMLFMLAILWALNKGAPPPLFLLRFQQYRDIVAPFLLAQTALTAGFGLYQAFYWNVYRTSQQSSRDQ